MERLRVFRAPPQQQLIHATERATTLLAPVVGPFTDIYVRGKEEGIIWDTVFEKDAGENERRLMRVNEGLLDGAVVVVMNHPDDRSNYAMMAVARKLTNRNRNATGFFVSRKFWTWERGPRGVLTLAEMKYVGVDPLRIAQKRHVSDASKRRRENSPALRTADAICKTPGGVLFFYPEGSRYDAMHQGDESGLTIFGTKASLILPLSVWPDVDGLHAVVHEPFSGEALRTEIQGLYPQDKWQQIFTDMVMIKIACALPSRLHGYYAPHVDAVFHGSSFLSAAKHAVGISA